MQALRIFRAVVGISQVELSEESGIRRASLTLYENGKAFASRRILKRIDDAYVRIVDRRFFEAMEAQRKERAEPGPEIPDDVPGNE